jgi:hypothetical protein
VAAYDGGQYDAGVDLAVNGEAVFVAARAGNSPYDVAVLRYDAATGAQAASSAPLGEGAGYFAHVRACDAARNCSPAIHAGPYGVDLTPPTPPGGLASSSHAVGVASDDPTVDLT